MKKILSLYLLILFVNICSAQSIKLMDDLGNDINGIVHYRYGTAANLDYTYFQVENLTANNITLKAKAEKVYVPYTNSGIQVTYSAGGNTASGNIMGPQIINQNYNFSANQLITNFRIAPATWMWVGGNDSAVWKVTIYDELNVNDSVSTTIVWKEGFATSVEKIVEHDNINIFPNPVIGNIFTINNLQENADEVVLYSIDGKEVEKYFLDGQKRSLNVDVSDLDTGIYYCSVKSTGNVLKTKKVIINK